MSGILIPELVISNILTTIREMLRKDLKDAPSDDKTILYRILGVSEDGQPIQIGHYNYFKQAKQIISDPKNLSVNFGYNQEVSKQCSLHLLLPSEQSKMAIGGDEGYINDINDNKVQPYYTQTYECTYQIMITSNNSFEVLIIYNIFKSMLLMLLDTLELSGLRNPSLSGNDIVMQENLIPIPIYHKVLNLHFLYEHNVPQLLLQDVNKTFLYEYRLIAPYSVGEELGINPGLRGEPGVLIDQEKDNIQTADGYNIKLDVLS